MAKRSLALLIVCLGALFALPALAAADTTDIIQPQNETSDQGFQSGTCTQETEAGKNCSPETPNIFFTTAAGHPPVGFTQYIIAHEPFTPLPSPPFPPGSLLAPIKEPISERTIKTLRTDLPPGLTVNPEATPSRCKLSDFFFSPSAGVFEPKCEAETITGEEKITLVTNKDEVEVAPGFKPPKGFVIPPQPGGTLVPIYNLEPLPGEPARLGFVINKTVPVILETEVAWESDWHESFTIKLPVTPKAAEERGLSTLISRLVSNGRSGDGTYLTTPTTCYDPNLPEFEHLYSTWFRAESYGDPDPEFPNGSTAVESKLPKVGGVRVQPTGCDTVPFNPAVGINPGTPDVDSPSPATVTTTLPFDPATEGGDKQSQSHVRKAEVALPKGMGLNPSGAQGLVTCSDAQFKKGVRTFTNECPAESDIGNVEVQSPPLAEPLVGDVYVGEPQSNDPASGNLYRILIEAKSEHEGLAARLVGNIKADPVTGQLTAVVNDQLVGPFAGVLPSGLPQVPFKEIRLQIDGSKEVLTSPPICSTESTSLFEPWARPGTTTGAKSVVTLTSDPAGGACPTTMAGRRFTPTYKANTDSTKGGSSSPFHVRIARADGEQELKVVDVTLPKGLTGKLAGIPYCTEAAIAAAIASSGKAEKADPSCSSYSRLGTVTTQSGTGANPLKLGGDAYLAGPYKGAPLSLVTVTPAVAGPYDLGTVVVRVALHVEPETAQIHAVSDVIPDVFGGAKLDLRNIDLDIDRPHFMQNPTNCDPLATTGAILGGGADPTNPATFSSYAVNDPFQATECDKLGFKTNLKVKLYGPTKRDKNPRLEAILRAREGDANIARTALTMPHSLFLDQDHIGTVCTRPQLASHTCPKASVYGYAEARSPLLDEKLKGQVYLVSSNNKLPDLLADLRGQVEIYLRGVISSKRGGLKTVFNGTPDVPVSKFVLRMKGGKKSLLVNSQNTCRKPQRAVLNIKGQNGKKVKKNRFKLNVVSCGKKR
ncbi:MAG TPA: hypothetical protein VK480_01780 [Solirubrobacterales bacterium]|nr:hypothetical protein [Solirubrobacterales bacterium]